MNEADVTLKRCPFCGAYPTLICDLTDWRGNPKYGTHDHVSYKLQANHKDGCFIKLMNGTNITGRMSAFNWKCLVEAWNGRVKE